MSSNTTITRLPIPVRIVSIPRDRVEALSHPLLRVLLKPGPAFLSITCNALELSLFAHLDADSVRAFQTISAADYSPGSPTALDPVEISDDQWSVLQIDSHSDQLDNAGARVSELSAPLAAAGISILYHSSYMSDFIFVKERRLAEAMGLFAAAGFALYAADPNLLTAQLTPPPSPVVPLRERSGSAPLPPTTRKSKSTSSSRSRKGKAKASLTPVGSTSSLSQAGSVRRRPVRVLAPNLACVGLADDAADYWALKIIKLVAFQDLVPQPSSSRPRDSTPEDEDEGIEDDGYFSHSPTPTTELESEEPEPRRNLQEENSSSIADGAEHQNEIEIENACVETRAVPSPLTVEGSALSAEPAISFFSFTRTPEGSSLTAGARVLATLFPRGERHMVICGGELDAADAAAEAATTTSSPFNSFSDERGAMQSDAGSDSDADDSGMEDEDDEDEGDDAGDAGSPLLCALQVDLRGPGLDTHGLVHRFSRALARGGVNHMYASTLRSANLLVPTGRARKGARLLRAC